MFVTVHKTQILDAPSLGSDYYRHYYHWHICSMENTKQQKAKQEIKMKIEFFWEVEFFFFFLMAQYNKRHRMGSAHNIYVF